MGVEVPTGSVTTTKDGVTTTRVDYRQIGTNIDCIGTIIDETRFGLSINIEDSSVSPPSPSAGAAARTTPDSASFRHFSASENVILKDGQTSEFTVATDKFTGEVIKADVTLTVVK
jgi:type II secretory pathway component GspD/PulD (secretin)